MNSTWIIPSVIHEIYIPEQNASAQEKCVEAMNNVNVYEDLGKWINCMNMYHPYWKQCFMFEGKKLKGIHVLFQVGTL